MRAKLSLGALPLLLIAACSSTSSAPPIDGGPPPDAGVLPTADAGLPRGIAQTCATDLQCSSGICGSNGLCCDQQCRQADSDCGTSSCDLHGACVYPDTQTPCGTSCSGAQLTGLACDGQGACKAGAPQPCPDHFGCAVGNTACATSCVDDTGCAANATCNAEGACVARKALGVCTADDQCVSGICDLHGSGACCVAACSLADSDCGAKACDPGTGACVYPSAGSRCSSAACAGAELIAHACDGTGSCAPTGTTPCPGLLACEPSGASCLLTCQSSTDCAIGGFCDLGGAASCCHALTGGKIFVDAAKGIDGPCCGSGLGTLACLTLNRAMQLVREAQAYGVIIDVNGSSGTETWPIQLGYGVTLQGNGAGFTLAADAGAHALGAFQIVPFPEENVDGGPAQVSLVNFAVSNVQTAVQVGAGGLFPAPANASLSSVTLAGGGGGGLLYIGPGSTLSLGPGAVNLQLQGASYGVYCQGDIPAQGGRAHLVDVAAGAGATPVLTITPSGLSTPAYAELWVGPYCDAKLIEGPSLGATTYPGSTSCQFDQYGVLVGYGATLTFGSAANPGLIHCMQYDGIQVQGSGPGVGQIPDGGILEVEGASIRYNDGAGINMQAGQLKVVNTAIVANTVGVHAASTDPTQLGTGTVLACNSVGNLSFPLPTAYQSPMYTYTPPGQRQPLNAGADLWVSGSGTVAATGLQWTDYGGNQAQTSSCDPSCFPYGNPATCTCACSGPNCANTSTGIPDGLDVVLPTGLTLDTSGGSSLTDPNYCANLLNQGI